MIHLVLLAPSINELAQFLLEVGVAWARVMQLVQVGREACETALLLRLSLSIARTILHVVVYRRILPLALERAQIFKILLVLLLLHIIDQIVLDAAQVKFFAEMSSIRLPVFFLPDFDEVGDLHCWLVVVAPEGADSWRCSVVAVLHLAALLESPDRVSYACLPAHGRAAFEELVDLGGALGADFQDRRDGCNQITLHNRRLLVLMLVRIEGVGRHSVPGAAAIPGGVHCPLADAADPQIHLLYR